MVELFFSLAVEEFAVVSNVFPTFQEVGHVVRMSNTQMLFIVQMVSLQDI